ncbi:major facilitator superfamily domain-containing protein [Aspergillus recurvatus]
MASFSKTTETKVGKEPVSLGVVPHDAQSQFELVGEGQQQQDAVRVADAITATWMWMLYFVNGLNNNLTSNLSAYITSDFSAHSQLTVISVVTSGAACLMPIAKVLNLWDRTVGVCIMILIAIIGLIMMACCTNIAIYCAAQAFYTVGFTGAIFRVDVLTADTSSKRNRGIAFGFTSSPYIITASPVALPLIITWELAKRKAAREHRLEVNPQPGRSFWQSTWCYIVEFDAPKPFIPYHLLVDRTIIGACLLDITYQVSYYCWTSYFTPFLQVVYNTSLTQAGYISAIFNLMDPVWLIGCGFLIRITGRFKWFLMCAVPLYLLASGLMIYFRTPGHSVGYMCMCQIFLAVGGGTMILIEHVAVLKASSHEDYAAMLALLSTFGNIGSAVGSSVSDAIWTNTLPQKLREYLPAETRHLWSDIYESLDKQLSYPVGSPARITIQNSYASSQRSMMIAGTAIMALSFGWVFLMRNIIVKERDACIASVLF